MVGLFVSLLAGLLVCLLVGKWVGWWVCWLASWLMDELVGWLVGWLTYWLVGWVVSWSQGRGLEMLLGNSPVVRVFLLGASTAVGLSWSPLFWSSMALVQTCAADLNQKRVI